MNYRDKVDCPACGGSGDVLDRRRIHSRSMEPPMAICPACGGSGAVDADEADEIDPDRELREYEADRAAARYEERMDARRNGDFDERR